MTARAALNEVKAITKREDLLKQIDDAVKSIEALAGCITHWKLAGPFKVDGKDGLSLMDVPLGPELADAKVEWTSPTAPTKAENVWQIDLLKKFTGNNRVAYAKCSVSSDKAQPALLELGSDDGIKVILNGQPVFSKNQVRQFRPGQDKVKIDLKQGENTLLLKVTQNGGDWMFSARLRNAEGGILEGLSVTK
jgi:hypothetical protein